MTATIDSAVLRSKPEYVSIQYLRGLAAMMVVIFHLKSQLERMSYSGWWPGGLSSGVDIFFVISGLIMVVTTTGQPITPTAFWWRRIVRIVPLYWLVTAFMTAVMFLAPQALQTATYDRWHVIASYLFIPAVHPKQGSIEPLVTPGWTLNYEMFFYLIFGLSLLLRQNLRSLATILTIIVLIGIGRVCGLSYKTTSGFYTSDIMIEFAFGMVLGEIALRGNAFRRMPRILGWLLVVGGLLLLSFPSQGLAELPRALSRGPWAFAVVLGTLTIESHGRIRNVPLLHALGNASYSIYLTQIIVTSALSQAWRHLGLKQDAYGLMLFSLTDIIACAVAGWLCYRFIERSLTNLLRPRKEQSGIAFNAARSDLQQNDRS